MPVPLLRRLTGYPVFPPRRGHHFLVRAFSSARPDIAAQQQQSADRLISSLPLIRYLRLNPSIYESRLHSSMHPDCIATHLVSGSLFGPSSIPTPPYFFVRWQPQHSIIGVCYIGSQLCGHPGFVHGGLLFTLLDDAWARCAASTFSSGVGMTAHVDIDFRSPSRPDRVYVYRIGVERLEGRKAWIRGQIRSLNAFDADEMLERPAAADDSISAEEEEGTLVVEGTALFVEPRDTTGLVPLYPGATDTA